MHSPNTIGERLALARSISGMSARELDRLAGKTEGHASLLEARHADDIQTSTATAYAAVLGLPLDWLVSGTGEIDPDAVRVAVTNARAARDGVEPDPPMPTRETNSAPEPR